MPRRLEERIRKESEKRGVSEEELVVKILSETLGERLDPDTSCELHLKLSEKYLREAEEFLAKGYYVQASEKAWGAAAQIVKALAAK
ncbi:MAG: PaREP1 family protein, partial [Thermofilum sp.]|nr:PaREP1 family protein [Thermofilum sp.]